MPVLSWDKVSGAVKYDVQVDNDPLFASPDEVAQTTNFRYVPKSRLAPGTQYWRVRAVNSANEASVGTVTSSSRPPSMPPPS